MARKEFSTATRKAALKRSGKRCEASGCGSPVFRRTFCAKHYSRLIRHGNINAVSGTPKGESLEWIMQHVAHDGDECLTFPFPRSPSGYGRVTYNGRRMGAHRAMCLLAHGPMPTAKHEAAHSCGNGHLGCVNPRHLRWATRSENLADRVEHYGGNRGPRHGNSKLTEESVIHIRELLSLGFEQAAIASEFGITQTTVSKIKLGHRWGWLHG